MSELMRLDEEYRNWIQELSNSRYRTSQIKACIRVNNEMLMFFPKYEFGFDRYDFQ